MRQKSNLLGRYTHYVALHPHVFLLAIVAISLVAGIAFLRLEIDASIYFIPKDYPSRVTEKSVKQIFDASGEQVVVMLKSSQADIYNTETLKTIAQLTNEFESLSLLKKSDSKHLREIAKAHPESAHAINKILSDGLSGADFNSLNQLKLKLTNSGDVIDGILLRAKPIIKVRSLFTVEDIRDVDDVLYTGKLIQEFPQTAGEINNIRKHVQNNQLFNGVIMPSDGSSNATAINIELAIAEDDAANMLLAYKRILEIIDNQKTRDQLFLSGGPILAAEIDRSVQGDNLKYFPFVIILISVLLFLFFRRIQAVFLALAIASITILWVMGLMISMGLKVNIITSALPVFIITIAVADAIHYLSKYYRLRQNMNAMEAIRQTNNDLLLPMLLTSITTIAGFLALSYSLFVQVQNFGLFTALGVLIAFILTITFLPALLPILSTKNNQKDAVKKYPEWPLRLGLWLDRITEKKRWLLLSLIIISVSTLAPYLKGIQVDNHNMVAFSEQTRLRQDDAMINQYFGGTIPLNIWFESKETETFSRVDVIKAVEKINQHILDNPEIGYTASTSSLIKRIHQVFNPDLPYQLPADLSRQLIAQYYLLYENGEGRDIRITLDEAHKNSRIFVLGHTDQASVWRRIIHDTEVYAKQVLPDDVDIHFSGFSDVMVQNTKEVVNGQITSIIIAALTILIIVSLIFKSLIIGLLSITPLTFTLLINFSAMVFFGVYLDIGTSLIIAIVFGVGVDYAIHLLTTLAQNTRELDSSEEDFSKLITNTVSTVSQPIIINSIVVAGGFLVLSLSDYAVMQRFGLLVSGTILLCGFFTLLILPLLLRVFKLHVIIRSRENNPQNPSIQRN